MENDNTSRPAFDSVPQLPPNREITFTPVNGYDTALPGADTSLQAYNLLPLEIVDVTHLTEQSAAGSEVIPVSPVEDPALVALVVEGGEALGYNRLADLLQINQPYNHSVTTFTPEGVKIEDPHFDHKHFIPNAIQYAGVCEKAGMTASQSDTLLQDMLAVSGDPEYVVSSAVTYSLSDALQPAAERGDVVTETDAGNLLAVASLITNKPQLPLVMHMVGAASRAGLGTVGGCDIVTEFYTKNSTDMATSDARHIITALDALDVANADPTLVRSVFTSMFDAPWDKRTVAYGELRDAVAYGGPATGQTTNQVLTRIVEAHANGATIRDAIAGATSYDKTLLTVGEQQIAPISTPPEQYFNEIPGGPLRHAMLPYRTVRSFTDGMPDISRLAYADPFKRQPAAAGGWVYDPASSTWYSLGGESQWAGDSRIRATQLPYDISRLSDKPVFVRIHPAVYAPTQPEKQNHTVPSPKGLRAIAALHERAGNTMDLQTLIAHHRGITEITFGNTNPAAIRELADDFGEIAQEAFDAAFGSWAMGRVLASEIGPERSTERMFDVLNTLLEGRMRLTFYPHGADLSHIAR